MKRFRSFLSVTEIEPRVGENVNKPFFGQPLLYSVPPSSGTYLGNVKESSSPRCIAFLAGNDVKPVKCCMIFKDILISREGFTMLSHCYSIVL